MTLRKVSALNIALETIYDLGKAISFFQKMLVKSDGLETLFRAESLIKNSITRSFNIAVKNRGT